jgi:peptide/nickel transport system substrate-binding protein
VAIFILAILSVSGWLTYEKFFNQFSFFQKDVVEIVFAENIIDYSPYSFVESNKQRLKLIYEPLVKLDETLQIIPAIANSFGKIDDLTWEFSINPQSKFHDGTPVRSEIIEQNFINYKLVPELSSLVDSIEKVTIINDLTLQITTKYPDASLLNKIAHLYIAPNIPIEDLQKQPIGTGPYKVAKIQSNKLSLLANENYYGRQPQFPKLVLTTLTDQFERNRYALKSDRVIMVYPVSKQFSTQITDSKFDFINFPTSSTNFFLFNFNRPKFQNLQIRKIFKTLISDELISGITDGLGKPTAQYVSEGVFGYNPELAISEVTDEQKNNLVRSNNLVGFDFKIALPTGLEVFAGVLENSFNKYGILPTIEMVDPSQVLSVNTMQTYDLIFLGWKSDYGDSTSFFENLAVSGAGLNLTNYNDSKVNQLLQDSKTTDNQETRLSLLRQAMQIIALENPIGIPLFETETIYAINAKYEYTPRVDGFVDPNNLKLKSE